MKSRKATGKQKNPSVFATSFSSNFALIWDISCLNPFSSVEFLQTKDFWVLPILNFYSCDLQELSFQKSIITSLATVLCSVHFRRAWLLSVAGSALTSNCYEFLRFWDKNSLDWAEFP